MITASAYKDKSVGVFGLARTGVVAAKALAASGAEVFAWDDNSERQKQVGDLAVDLYEFDFENLDELLLAPGVPLTHPKPHALVKKANETAIKLISDFDVFEAARAELPAHKVVAITGTNGKSTTTTLIAHMIAECGLPVAVGGNIGTGVLALDPLPEGGVYVFEMSSFQLDLTKAFNADIAVLLNITPDHLDRHGDMAGYVAAKKCLFDMQTSGDAVISIDDEASAMIADSIANVVRLSVEATADCQVKEATLYFNGQKIANVGNFPHLQGVHNQQNAACAYAVGTLLGLSSSEILNSFESFSGLEHRQELVASIAGVSYINDSKATNSDAAIRALSSFNNIHWIACGKAKETSFSHMQTAMQQVNHAYFAGEVAPLMADGLSGAVTFSTYDTMIAALKAAHNNAVAGDVILLSPACTAFDEYANFEERGTAFKDFVLALDGAKS